MGVSTLERNSANMGHITISRSRRPWLEVSTSIYLMLFYFIKALNKIPTNQEVTNINYRHAVCHSGICEVRIQFRNSVIIQRGLWKMFYCYDLIRSGQTRPTLRGARPYPAVIYHLTLSSPNPIVFRSLILIIDLLSIINPVIYLKPKSMRLYCKILLCHSGSCLFILNKNSNYYFFINGILLFFIPPSVQ